MQFIDLKYVRLLQSKLPNFRQVKANNFVFSHDCEDLPRGKIKRRGSIFPFNGIMMMHCYHCSVSMKFSTFLSNEDPNLYREYRMEIFKETQTISSFKPAEIFKPKVEEIKQTYETELIPISTLKDTHPVIQYVTKRRIPIEHWSKIFLVKDFNQFASKFDKVFEKLKHKHPRLVFPFYDKDGSIICYNCRAFGNEQPKYVKLTVDPNKEKIYGLWRVDESRPIFVTEGQIDSLFVDNCVAAGSADYSAKWFSDRKDAVIIVPDSDYKRNPQVYKLLENAIDSGFKISLMPESIPWKDINDCVMKGNMTIDKINSLLRNNVTCGLKAKMELISRKKF